MMAESLKINGTDQISDDTGNCVNESENGQNVIEISNDKEVQTNATNTNTNNNGNVWKEESISEDISETYVLKAVGKKLKNEPFLLLNYELKPLTERLGLLGEHSIIHVSYLNDQGTKEYLTLFVKYIPKFPAQAKFAEGIGAFKKEIFVYKMFKEFSKEGIELVNHIVSECYVTVHNTYLIMDDLSSDGYQSINKHTVLDYDSVLVVLQALAKLHASSIIYEHKMKYTLSDLYPNDLEESYFNDKADFASLKGTDASIKSISDEIELFQFPKVLKSGKNFADVAKEVCYKIYDLVKPSMKFKNVLTHGDIWATNILLKHDVKTNKTVSCKLVDFQCGRYAPPAQDVLAFLFLNTSREYRKQYMYEVVGMYYSYLEKNLKFLGIDINNVMPFSSFMESCEEQKIFAIVQTALYFPLILINNNDIDKYFKDTDFHETALYDNRVHLIKEQVDKDDFYRKRLKESIEDLKDFCEQYNS